MSNQSKTKKVKDIKPIKAWVILDRKDLGLFSKEYYALSQAMEISYRYWVDSPVYDKRSVGEDIYFRIIKLLK